MVAGRGMSPGGVEQGWSETLQDPSGFLSLTHPFEVHSKHISNVLVFGITAHHHHQQQQPQQQQQRPPPHCQRFSTMKLWFFGRFGFGVVRHLQTGASDAKTQTRSRTLKPMEPRKKKKLLSIIYTIYTGWLIGILTMVYYIPRIIG